MDNGYPTTYVLKYFENVCISIKQNPENSHNHYPVPKPVIQLEISRRFFYCVIAALHVQIL